jgi:hypothetical protein
MKQSIGIVLKSSHTHEQDIVLLDRYLGKISGTMVSRTPITVGNGTVMTYTLVRKKSRYTFESIDLEYVPFSCARDDIFFLHHVLELCYYFLPEECAVDEVFQMLIYLIHIVPYEKVAPRKYVVLARLLFLFGLYPEHDIVCSYLQGLVDMSLDHFFDAPHSEHMRASVRQWVWSCIMTHPAKRQFKTIGLLKRAEVA